MMTDAESMHPLAAGVMSPAGRGCLSTHKHGMLCRKSQTLSVTFDVQCPASVLLWGLR